MAPFPAPEHPVLERLFQLQANGTTVRTEVLVGLTTFLKYSISAGIVLFLVIIIAMMAVTGVSVALGLSKFTGFVAMSPSLSPAFATAPALCYVAIAAAFVTKFALL